MVVWPLYLVKEGALSEVTIMNNLCICEADQKVL
jgi:hypothetical protein